MGNPLAKRTTALPARVFDIAAADSGAYSPARERLPERAEAPPTSRKPFRGRLGAQGGAKAALIAVCGLPTGKASRDFLGLPEFPRSSKDFIRILLGLYLDSKRILLGN